MCEISTYQDACGISEAKLMALLFVFLLLSDTINISAWTSCFTYSRSN